MSCPTYQYPCMYGNRAQTRTAECEHYWRDDTDVSATVEADTIFMPSCTQDANDLASELALYEAQSHTSCDPCCFRAMCISLVNPEDIQYVQYWNLRDGLLLSQDVQMNFQLIQNCPVITPFIRFIAFEGNPSGLLAQFGLGTRTVPGGSVLYIDWGGSSRFQPEKFTMGWDCEQNCAPNGRVEEVLTFPFGLAVCSEGNL